MSASCWHATAAPRRGGPRRGFDVSCKLAQLGYKEQVEIGSEPVTLSGDCAPEAIAGNGCTAFHVDATEISSGSHAKWSAFLTNDGSQFYISAPGSISSSSKQSLVSLLEIAESLGCSTAWMYVDRQRPDFISIVSAFKYLGFQLSQSVFKDKSANKVYALLRYELE